MKKIIAFTSISTLMSMAALGESLYYGDGYENPVSALQWGSLTNADTVNLVVKSPDPTSVKGTSFTVSVNNLYHMAELNVFNNTSNSYSGSYTNAQFIFDSTEAFFDIGAVQGVGGGNWNLFKEVGDTQPSVNYVGRLDLRAAGTFNNFTNAANVYLRSIYVGYNNNITHLIMDTVGQTVNVGEVFCVGNGVAEGSSVTTRTGNTISSDYLIVTTNNWTNNTRRYGIINIEGGNILSNNLGIGNAIVGYQPTDVQIEISSDINFLTGTLSGRTSTLYIRDLTKTAAALAKNISNTGSLNFNFGGEYDENGDSKNVFSLTSSKGVTIDNTVILKDYEYEENYQLVKAKGGFTVSGDAGTFATTATGALSGTISVKGGTTFINKGDATFNTIKFDSTGTFINEANNAVFGNIIINNGNFINRGNVTFNPINFNSNGNFLNEATNAVFGNLTILGGSFTNKGSSTFNSINFDSNGNFVNEADNAVFGDITMTGGYFKSFKDNGATAIVAKYGSVNIDGDAATFYSTGGSTFKDIIFRGDNFYLSNFAGGKVLGKFDVRTQKEITLTFDKDNKRQFFSDATLIRVGEKVTLSNQEKYKNDNGELNPNFTVFTIKANQTLAGGGFVTNTGAPCLFDNGKMYGSNMLIQGTLAPSGDDGNAGMLKFWGDLVFDSTAIIKLDVFGTSESKFDRVQSLYNTSYFAMRDYDEDGIYATLIFDVSQFDLSDSGILNITDFLKLNNAEGSITKFDILFQKNGEFVNDPQYWVDYETGNIHFGSIPEPATIATILGAIALGIISYRRRK